MSLLTCSVKIESIKQLFVNYRKRWSLVCDNFCFDPKLVTTSFFQRAAGEKKISSSQTGRLKKNERERKIVSHWNQEARIRVQTTKWIRINAGRVPATIWMVAGSIPGNQSYIFHKANVRQRRQEREEDSNFIDKWMSIRWKKTDSSI